MIGSGLLRSYSLHTRRLVVVLGVAVWSLGCGSIAQAFDYPIVCDDASIGLLSVNTLESGLYGGFTSSEGVPASLSAAAQFCGADHFNWFQVIIFDNDAPYDVHGVKQVAPYIDPPLGGYGNPDVQWADGLPWLWDEGADPPSGTPGFEDGYNLTDVIDEFNPGSGPDKFLFYEDFPGGAPNSTVGFNTWLVSVGADGTLHEFYNGFSWLWSNPGGGVGSSNILPAPLTPSDGMISYLRAGGPTFAADFDRNANVDRMDFISWTAGFGKTSGAVLADGNADADQDVDGADFLTWQRQFGQQLGTTVNNQAVPEPTGAALLVAGLCVVAQRRRAS